MCAVRLGHSCSRAQQKYAPIVKDPPSGLRISFDTLPWSSSCSPRLSLPMSGRISSTPSMLDKVPLIGLAVAAAILLTIPIARPDWSIVPRAARGAIFLIALVSAASLMPVKSSKGRRRLGLGFVSAVFDNIPLTALAIKQGNYDWGFLAYAVGFGGSMIWFGSSAGVAVAGLMPEAKSTVRWLKEGGP